MGKGAEDINDTIDAGRKTIELSRGEMEDELEERQIPSVPVLAGVAAVIVGLGVLGWLIYRNRQKRTLVQQLVDALPVSLDDVRDEVRSQLKRVRSR